jgi:hypothetical protein
MAWIKSLKQGDCDYFCCLYSITNALSKFSSSKLGYRSQIYVFNRLLEKLVSIGGLQNIEKKGVPYTKAVKLLKTTQKILFDKYKLKIEINEPFYGQEADIEKLKKKPPKMTVYELWLGWLDSNQRMSAPKADALPLGDTPICSGR